MRVRGITGDTKISLLNGTEQEIHSITENYQGNPIFLYSIDNQKKIHVGIGWSPRCYGKSDTLIITLDNQEEFLCSPSQKLLLRDGSAMKAKKLDVGQSLMPLYREISTKGFLKGYEKVYRPDSQAFSQAYIHQIVGKWKFGKRYSRHSGFDLHHLDFDKKNNDPTNIDLIPRSEHEGLHARKPKIRYKNDMDFIKAYKDRRIPRPIKNINHTIVSIEKGPRENLYGLIIVDTEIYALTAGVFVVGI